MRAPRQGDSAKAEDLSRARAVALVRSLGMNAQGNGEYLEFARTTTLSHEPVHRLSNLVGATGLRPFSHDGDLAFKKAESALSSALDFSVPYKAALTAVEAATEELCDLEASSRRSLQDIEAPMPDVLSAEDAEAYARFQRTRLSTLCYFTAMLYGADKLAPIRDVSLGSGNAQRALESCLTAISRLKASLASARPLGAWRIDQSVPVGCEYFPAASGFVFRPLTNMPYEDLVRGARLREISPGFATGHINGYRCYAGLGYLVGTRPERSEGLREPNVHTKLPLNAFGFVRENYDDPLAMMRVFFGDDAYCINPEHLAEALTRHARCVSAGGA